MANKVEVSSGLSLASKLAQIGKEIGKVQKSGKNQEQKYNYIEYGVVAGRIRELLAEYKVIIIPSVEEVIAEKITSKYGSVGFHYRLTMNFKIINGEKEKDSLEARWIGEASDFGDKGINKAETSGTKYFLMRLFNVSEKGEEEADSKSPEARQVTKRQEAPTEVQRKVLTAYMMELGKTDEEINRIQAVIKTKALMTVSIQKAKQMVLDQDASESVTPEAAEVEAIWESQVSQEEIINEA